MTESENNFSFWKAMGAEHAKRPVDFFLNMLDLLSPLQRRAFIAAHPHREDLVDRIGSIQGAPTGLLTGVPYVLQDLFDVADLPTRCGAPFQEPFEHLPDESSRLHATLDAMGAVLMAKTVPSEFGVDLRGRNKRFGDCPHADSGELVCGGGAGSCAHAVKKGWVPLAFGLDSMGGVRVPAAFHGLFGFRMHDHSLAREGTFPIVPSLESVGWMTRTLGDLTTTFQAFYPDANLGPTGPRPRGLLLREPGLHIDKDVKSGLVEPLHYLNIEENPEINHALCHRFKPAAEALKTIQKRELYAIHKYWLEEYRDQYEPNLLDAIESGRETTVKQADHAAAVQLDVRECFVDFFQDFDFLMMPISPVSTPSQSAWNAQLELALTQLNAPASLARLPALILPFQGNEGRHSAVQIILRPDKLQQVPALLKQIARIHPHGESQIPEDHPPSP